MQTLNHVGIFTGLLLSVAGGCERPMKPQGQASQNQQTQQEQQTQQTAAPAEPEVSAPLVLMGEGELVCNIDRAKNGVQKLVLKKGSGVEFDATVSPIVDGTVRLKGPKQGGEYRFTSHLAAPAKGKLSGVGEVAIEKLETKVTVTVTAYDQPSGPGTPFTFTAAEMQGGGAYVEFNGVARAENGQRYAFRVNLTEPRGGSGKVTPVGPNFNDHIYSKMVIVQAPVVTSVVESRATVQPLP